MPAKIMPFQKKLILSTTCIVTAAILLIAASSYFVIKNTLDNRINREISATLSSKAQEFDKWIIQQQSTINYFGDSILYNDSLNTLSESELEAFLASKVTEYVIDYYIVRPDGKTTFASGFQLPEDFDVTARDWYKATLAANGALTCTSPYIDNNTSKLCMTISQAYYKGGQLDFVIGADIYADYLAELTESINIFNNAYAILADSDLNVIVHRSDDYRISIGDDGNAKVTSLRDIPEYSGLLTRLESDDSSVLRTSDYDGTSRYFVMSDISSTGWHYIYAVDWTEYYQQIVPLMISMVVIFIIDIVVCTLVSTVLIKKLMKPIEELKTATADMKNGKLDYTPTYFADDSIGDLCTSISDTNKVWTGYITDINTNLSKLSHGNFDIQFNGEYVGDFAEIKTSISHISDKLSAIIGGIDTASSQVSTGAEKVAESSNSLAAGVNEQSRTIEELTALIGKLVSQINENAASAEAAQKQSNANSGNVIECNRRMTELMESMDNINKKSQEIVNIVQTIDDIAFQTNILALNAAVEAARAGEAGKGFAVVAGEVRNLASKCTKAVQNTTELITGTSEAVESGAKLAQETGAALESVSQGVSTVNSLVVKISEASEIQAADVKTVSEKISDIESIVHTTAVTAEESAASSEELNSQSRTLQDMVDRFRNR
ncbi:MAG: methyl-accepting chemotaxis protein [Oscillospiraceae bacterium]